MNLKFYQELKTILVTVLLFASTMALVAQNRITGTVYESDGKTPLVGASVVVNKHNVGTATDINGHYSIDANAKDILTFYFMGYDRVEVTIGNRTTIDVVMKSSDVEIGPVVVTALGLTRKERSLGYATTTVDGDELWQRGSGNWLESLSGKVPGLKLDQAGTGPMGSIRVTLRGDNSLNYGNNEVLVVVDGVPVNSGGTSTSSGSTYANADAPVDFGNGLSDINPDDIESINVLKGAAATALYGSRAGNGALIITTRKAKKQKGLSVSLSSSTTFERAMRFPDFQTEYGGGGDNGLNEYSFWTVSGENTSDGNSYSRNQSRYAFGEKYDENLLRMQYNSRDWETGIYTPLPWVYQDNWFTGFFETGVTTKNIVSVNGSNGDGSSMRMTVTDVRGNWVIPNTPNSSQTFSLNAQHKVNKSITLKATVNYLKRNSDNVPYSGYGSKNPLYSLIWSTSNHDINKGFKAEYFAGRFTDPAVRAENALFYNAENSYNPYFTVYEETNTVDRDRVYGNFNATINLVKGLILSLRSGLDLNNEFRTQRAPIYSGSSPGGFYREQTIRNYETNNDFLLTYQRYDFDDRLSLNAGFGGVNWRQETANTRLNVPRLGEDNIFTLTNVKEGYRLEATGNRTAKEVNSFLGFANLGWKDFIYVDITGRQDWTSTLASGYNSYFYPSVGVSFLADEAFDLKRNYPWISMVKVRGSLAKVGIDTAPYSLVESAETTDYSGGFRVPTTQTTVDLSPEMVTSYETGLDLAMLDNRVTFNATYYLASSKSQIVSTPVDPLTGATTIRKNAGEIRNTGVELAATFAPFRQKNGFNWSFSLNWSKNNNKLVSMYDGWNPESPLQTQMGTTIGNRVYVYSFVGEEMHWIYGKDYVRAPEGSTYIDENGNTQDASGMKIIDSKTGMPALTPNADQRIAKVNPDWYAGMSHTFSYKNVSLGFHLAAQWGGHTYSANHFALAYQGKLKNSLAGRYDGLVVDGVNAITDANGNVTYQKNNAVTENIQTYYNAYVYIRDNVRENTFSTSYLKLKNLNIDYTFPTRLLRKTGFVQSAVVGVSATNLFCWTDYPMFDPETGNLHGTNIHRGVETGSLPMTQSFSVNVKMSF